jgi:hypothetical protein
MQEYMLRSIYIETSVRNKCRCSFYYALFTLRVSAPIGGHLQVFNEIYICLCFEIHRYS